ncbi:MAG: class I SAM-dependent methyltransferase [Candidatus Paceibacterota bacterium]
MNNISILTTKPSKDYELIDSGNGEKLERWGEFILRRPDPQALWQKRLSEKDWNKADAFFDNGVWKTKKDLPDNWHIELNNIKFSIKSGSFKHTGVFPEQSPNWDWIRDVIKKNERELNVLNLFGYTGGATLAAAEAGANVTHVDASKPSIELAKENARISGLSEKPIRWIVDDARKFVEREIKRGKKYDGIIMDPPAFGRGPKGEVWKIEDCFLDLFKNCELILSEKPIFVLINGYAAGYSAISYRNNLEELVEKFGGSLEMGELAIEESKSERLLPAGIFARWSSI